MSSWRTCPKCAQMTELLFENNIASCAVCGYVYPPTPSDPAEMATQSGYVWPFVCPACGTSGLISLAQRDHVLPVHCVCGYYRPANRRKSPAWQQEHVVRQGVRGWDNQRSGRQTPYSRG